MRHLKAIISFALLLTSCEKQVELRKFPYPYKAAFTICSDIDNTETVEEFIKIHNIINRTDTDSCLGLDIGDSFWFYNEQQELNRSGDFDSSQKTDYFFIQQTRSWNKLL